MERMGAGKRLKKKAGKRKVVTESPEAQGLRELVGRLREEERALDEERTRLFEEFERERELRHRIDLLGQKRFDQELAQSKRIDACVKRSEEVRLEQQRIDPS